MYKRKGITPVIAIVLLLLITVGAVTVVYDQFQSLTEDSDASQQLEDQQQIQQASYSIIGVSSSDSGTPTNGEMQVTVKNTGDENLDLTTLGTLLIGRDGQSPQATSAQGGINCGAEFGQLERGETATCNTGVDWPTPDDGQSTDIRLRIGEVVKASYTCTAESGSQYC